MDKTAQAAFLDGYMHKEGKGFTLPAVVTMEFLRRAWPYLLATPPLIGVASGAAHAALTSPSSQDEEAIQKAIYAAEQDELLTDLQRQRESAARKRELTDSLKKVPAERKLHLV